MLFVQGVWRLLTHHINLLQVAVTCSVVAAAVTPGALVANVGEDAPSVREGFGPGESPKGAQEDVACWGVEWGLHWLRIRQHLQRLSHFDVSGSSTYGSSRQNSIGLAGLRSIATGILRAIEEDTMVSSKILWWVLDQPPQDLPHQYLGCKVGVASLRLLRCFVELPQKRIASCSRVALEVDLAYALGMIDDENDLSKRVHGQWPTLPLIVGLVEHTRIDRGWATDSMELLPGPEKKAFQEGFELLRGMLERSAIPDRSSAVSLATGLLASATHHGCGTGKDSFAACPFKPPFSDMLCGATAGSLTIRLASPEGQCIEAIGIALVARPCGQDGDIPRQQFLVSSQKQGLIRWAGHPGHCFDVRRGRTGYGSVLQMWECKLPSHPNQQFIIHFSTRNEGQIKWASQPSKCLEVVPQMLSGHQLQPGVRSGDDQQAIAHDSEPIRAEVQLWECRDETDRLLDRQVFRMPLGKDTGPIMWEGLCLDIDDNVATNKQPVHLTKCFGKSSFGRVGFPDLILPESVHSIRLAEEPNLCIEVGVGVHVDQAALALNDCDERLKATSQGFLIPGKPGPIRSAALPETCVHVEKGGLLGLRQCQMAAGSSVQQHFYIHHQGERRCQRGGGASVELAAASGLIALATWGTKASATASGLQPELLSCQGLERICNVAAMNADMRLVWKEVTNHIHKASVFSKAPLLDLLASSHWPVPQLLAVAARVLHSQRPADERERSSSSASSPSSSPPLQSGICACDMRHWLAPDAKIIAAAYRVLSGLHPAKKLKLKDVLTIVTGPDAEVACGQADLESRMLFRMYLARDIWRLRASIEDGGKTELSIIMRLREASRQNFDPGSCVPGITAQVLVCSLRRHAMREVEEINKMQMIADTLLTALSGCAPLASSPLATPHEIHEHFLQDWWGLWPWIYDTKLFFSMYHEKLVESAAWRLVPHEIFDGTQALGRMTASGSARAGASACTGVWRANQEQQALDCHSLLRNKGLNRRSDEDSLEAAAANGVPITRILGVGMTKAGTTLIWQAMGAASQLSMGMDCSHTTNSTAVRSALRREAPLEAVISLCFDELFQWELAKDAHLTPIARRLASAWPALSGHGGKLALYYVTRNPFDNVRSILNRWGLTTRVNSAAEQSFKFDAGTWSKALTKHRLRHFDVERRGLNYSGFIDAMVQFWAVNTDYYLECPTAFALVRYEDVVRDPVGQVRKLIMDLGHSDLWLTGAEERVIQTSNLQYQAAGSERGEPHEMVFGEAMLKRMKVAVQDRAELLGYAALLDGLRVGDVASSDWPPIDMPLLPSKAEDC